jgi:hypothetical protein
MIKIFEAARQLQAFCDRKEWKSCIIGGIAVQRWGNPRVTLDVDLTVLTGFGSEDPIITALTAEYPARIDSPAAFARRNRVLLLKTPDGVGIDISLGALPFEERVISRASLFAFGPNLDIRTCSAEDLIVLKLFASRPLDIQDAEGVVLRQKGRLDWRYIEEQLGPLAEAKEEPEILQAMTRLRNLRI